MSTHNLCFRGEIRKICGYHLLSVALQVDAFKVKPPRFGFSVLGFKTGSTIPKLYLEHYNQLLLVHHENMPI